MSRRSRADLWGCIRLVNVPDSIGVPVFSVYNSNSLWVPETDGDFRITRFLLLSPDSNYRVIPQVPPGIARRRLMIGEHAPLPFWIDGRLHQVNGSAYSHDMPDIATRTPEALNVLQDVRRLLDDARNGRFKARLQQDEAERIADAFPDVFDEMPIHSKYWVSRFRLAATEIVPGSRPQELSDRLRSIGRQWLQRFGSKTDLGRFKALIETGHNGIFSGEEVRNLYFAFIVDRISRFKIADVVRIVLQNSFYSTFFPGGIYQFYKYNHWPNTPFEYSKPRVLTEPLLSAIRDNHKNSEVLSALRGLAYIYFGETDAPTEFSQRLLPFRQAAQQQMLYARERMREIEKMGLRFHDNEYFEQVDSVIDGFDRLMYLDGIDYAKTRLNRKINTAILGLTTEYIDHLKRDYHYLAWKRERNEPEDWRE